MSPDRRQAVMLRAEEEALDAPLSALAIRRCSQSDFGIDLKESVVAAPAISRGDCVTDESPARIGIRILEGMEQLVAGLQTEQAQHR